MANVVVFPSWDDKKYSKLFRFGLVPYMHGDREPYTIEDEIVNCRNCGSGHIRENRHNVRTCSYCGSEQ